MLSKRTKHFLSCFFLSTFLLLQVASLHGLTHKDNGGSQNCTWCYLSTVNNLTPFIGSDAVVEIPVFVLHDHFQIASDYDYVPSEKPAVCSIFNKPPPSFYTV